MKKRFRLAPLSLLLTVSLASPALADECKQIHGTILDAQVTEGCTSPNRFCAAGTVKGNQEYQDHGPAQPMNVKAIQIQSITCNPALTQATIFGTASINGAGVFQFRIDVQDLGEPGRTDTYRIRLSNGYDSGVQTLDKGGNIKIHKA